MYPSIEIGGRRIAEDAPCYVIAEIGVNHNGDLALAHRLIDAAAEAGADAVKFQTYLTDELVMSDVRQAAYQSRNLGESGTQADMLRQLELPFSAFAELAEHCRRVGVDFISTAFDAPSLEFVISLRPVCLKWASGELTNKPLLMQAAQTGLPLLLSTGMGSLTEIARTVDWLAGRMPLVILQCVSDYPAAIEDQNLRVLPALRNAFGCPSGFSDHTIGPYAALAARSLGMAVLEKHFTLDKTLPGPDHRASVEPAEFGDLVRLLRAVEAGLGDGVKRPRAVENDVRAVARKSLVWRADRTAGHIVTAADLTAKRPGTGVAPDRMDDFVGRRLGRSVAAGTMVVVEDVR
jgi:N-acetylneuraminate synthase/N,N'-diacetyllegionaminate synthase